MTREQFVIQVEAQERHFRRFLLALCCGDSTQADDIAQESYLKAYLSLGTLEKTESFKSWIFRIGHNTFLSHIRNYRPTDDIDSTVVIASDSESDSTFKYQDLYSALDQLPPKERTSILLYYMEGYSVKEISDIIESNENAVRQQLSRGRQHLKKLLNNK